MGGGHVRRMKESNHRIPVTNDEVGPLHSASYQTGPTATQLSTEEANGMIVEMIIKPATTE